MTEAESNSVSLERFVIAAIEMVCGLDASAIDLRTRTTDIDLTSLALMSLIANVQSVYTVEFTTQDVLECLSARTVGDVVDIVKHRVGSTG